MAGLLLLGNGLGDGDKNLHSKETDAVLVIGCEVLEKGHHVFHHHISVHLLDELGHVCGGLTADHGSLVVNELAERLSQFVLRASRDLAVGCGEEAAARHL